MSVENNFPRTFRVSRLPPAPVGEIEFNLYKVADKMSWEGYYRGQRVSIFWTGWYWCVGCYRRGEMTGYFRHYRENPTLDDIGQLVQAACYLIDIFLE